METKYDIRLCDVYPAFPDLVDMKHQYVELRCSSAKTGGDGQVWQRVKTLQRKSESRKLKIVLYPSNWENDEKLGLIRRYWKSETRVDVRMIDRPLHQGSDKFVLCDSDDNDDTQMEEDGDDEKDEPDLDENTLLAHYLESLRLNEKEEENDGIYHTSRLAVALLKRDLRLHSLDYEFSVQESFYLRSLSDTAVTASFEHLRGAGLFSIPLTQSLKTELLAVLGTSNIPNIVDVIEEINEECRFYRLADASSGSISRYWFCPYRQVFGKPKVIRWKGLNEVEMIKYLENVILGLVDVILIQLKETTSGACSWYTTTLRKNVQGAFANNGKLILDLLEQNIVDRQQEQLDDIPDEEVLDIWMGDNELYLNNGVTTVTTTTQKKEDQTECTEYTFSLQPYETPTIFTRHIHEAYKPDREVVPWEKAVWRTFFPDAALHLFALQLLGTCIFKAPKSSRKAKTIVVLEAESQVGATFFVDLLSTVFASYMLRYKGGDRNKDAEYVGIMPGDDCDAFGPIDKSLHCRYRFALADLSDLYTDVPYRHRFDVAAHLGSDVPHIIIGLRGISQHLNTASHDPPYVIPIARQHPFYDDAVSRVPGFGEAFLTDLLQCWKTEFNLPDVITQRVPQSIKVQRAALESYSEKAITFITERIVRSEEDSTVTVTELTEQFVKYLQGDGDKDIAAYKFLALDHLVRLVNGTGSNIFHWKSLRILTAEEPRPPYAHLLGSVNDKMFEIKYHRYKEENKNIKVTRDKYYAFCQQTGRPTIFEFDFNKFTDGR